MSEKISLVLDTVVKGTEDILSTTTATERLTAAIEEERNQVRKVNGDLKKVTGYQSAIKSMKRMREQYRAAEADVARLSKEQADHKETTRKLRVEYAAADTEVSRLNAQLKKTSGEGAVQLQNRLDSAKNRMNALNIEMGEGKVRTSDLNKAYKQATKRVNTLSEKQVNQTNKLKKLGGELKDAGVHTNRLAAEQRKLERESEKATAAIAKQNEHLKKRNAIKSRIDTRNAKLSDIGGQASSLAMKAMPLGASVYSAVKNESSFADVKKVVDMSPEEAAQLRSWSLRTSASKEGGGLKANEINDMLAAGGQSGIQDVAELKSFVLDSAAMGVAFDMEAGQAGETLATFKAALGLDQEGAMGLASTANSLSNKFNAKAGDIAGVMARQGASAKMAGFNVNESSALATSMLATGMNEESAATALKNISGRLTLGSAATNSQRGALSKIGYNSEELASSMQTDASGTLMGVLDAIKDAPLEEQGALISQIFGEEAKGAISALAGNTELYQEALAVANQEQSTHIDGLQKEFASRISTTEGGISGFINKVTRLSVIFGNSLLPALNWVLEPLGNAAMLLGDFAEANEGVTSAVAIGVTGFVALKAALLAGKAASLIFGNTLDKGKLFRNGLDRETSTSGKAAKFATKQIRKLSDALYDIRSHEGGDRSRPYERRERVRKSQPNQRSRSRSRVRSLNMAKSGKRGLFGKIVNLGGNVLSSASNRVSNARNIINNRGIGGDARRFSSYQTNTSDSYRSNRSKRFGRSRNLTSRVLNIGRSLFSTVSNKMGNARHVVGNTATSVGARAFNTTSNVMRANKGALPMSLGGGALAMMPMMAAAQDAVDIGGDIAEGIGKSGLSKVLRPLSMAISAGNIATALTNGNTKEAVTEGGSLLGGMGGASLGAALGTAIFPGVGTVVGGLVGSLAGDFFGGSMAEWLGDKLTPMPNKLMQPEEVETRLAENRKKEATAKSHPPVKVDAPIQIHAAPGMDPQQIAMEVKRQLEESLQMTGMSIEDSLSVSYIDA
ncbi:phage tail tape measure protein [Vibrio sp. 03-59-1]|uniref:phage tail tape measure protein n=1 Tax=Vibrio sp. 03-59-1 TaxID=2607607 RepID=UPI0014933506|nr:phage tail tape measure protein [Vibrio sp. 03-59-1]NOH85543.1 phage tail tape measure protein [Vibrio sp. 03-59-1]